MIESIVFLEPVATAVARFWIGRAEVTVGEYARCVAAGGCTAPAKGGVHDLAGNGREWTSTGDEQTRVSKGMACDGEIACYAFNRFVNQFVEEQLDYLGFPLRAQDGPGPDELAFTGRAPTSAPPTPRKVHWSTLIDTFAETRGPVSGDTICFVEVAFDGTSSATSARAVDVASPDQPACPAALRPLAEKAARSVKVGAREGGAETTLPVRITK